jgi:hypothetical protein
MKSLDLLSIGQSTNVVVRSANQRIVRGANNDYGTVIDWPILTVVRTAFALVFWSLLVVARAGAADLAIDADYPGGNIVVDDVEGDTVYLHQYKSKTTGYKSYWNFRVRGAAGRTLTFEFTTERGREHVMGLHGPAVSTNRGHSWSWLWAKAVERLSPSFKYTFAEDAKEVRFCFTMPCVETDLRRFLNWHADDPHLSVRELCKTRKGRTVERVHVGCLDGQPKYRVLLTARHHSCEAMASYFLIGILKGILADSDDSRWFRRNVEVMAFPLMDKDGVEDGDQGKGRQPHDHNRDYLGESIYPSVAALRELVPRWSAGQLHIAMDMHCPGTFSKTIYMIGSTNAAVLDQQREFHRILKSVETFTLAYKGEAPSVYETEHAEAMFMNWAAKLKGIRLSTTFELPYADVHGKMMTPRSNVRAFCHGLIRAMRIYLEGEEAGVKRTTGSETGETEALPKGKPWKLVWSDEFDGSKLDESKWGLVEQRGRAFAVALHRVERFILIPQDAQRALDERVARVHGIARVGELVCPTARAFEFASDIDRHASRLAQTDNAAVGPLQTCNFHCRRSLCAF